MPGRTFLPAICLFLTCTGVAAAGVEFKLPETEQDYIIETADAYLDSIPYSVTIATCDRSAGGPNDYYSEGTYWWPDPDNPDGPYIRRDGLRNPDNFEAHHQAMVRFSRMVGTLTSAYLLKGDDRYVKKVEDHLRTWFVDRRTHMTPHMLCGQAIKGRVTGRRSGIIDTIQLVEVARAVKLVQGNPALSVEVLAGTKQWFRDYLSWISTHRYGIEERDWHNNHATCWVMQAAAFADLIGDREMLAYCKKRFKEVLLPNQMAPDGSFPDELSRTRPYSYSLFHLDIMATVCQILSTPEDNLWTFVTPDNRGIRKGVAFLYPYIADKSSWPYQHDVMYWEQWPVRQISLLFAALAYDNEDYLRTWHSLDGYPTKPEAVRGMPIRHPLLWVDQNQ